MEHRSQSFQLWADGRWRANRSFGSCIAGRSLICPDLEGLATVVAPCDAITAYPSLLIDQPSATFGHTTDGIGIKGCMFHNLRSSQFLAPVLVSLAGITAAPPSEAAQEPPSARSVSPAAADTSLYSPLQLGNARISEMTPQILYEIANRIKTLRKTKEGISTQVLCDLTEALEKQLVALSEHGKYLANFTKPPSGTLSEKRSGELLDLAIWAYLDLLKSLGKDGVEYRPETTNLQRITVTADFAQKSVSEIATCPDSAKVALLRLLARDTLPQTLRNDLARALLRSGIPGKIASEDEEKDGAVKPRTALVTTLGRLRVSDPAALKEVAGFIAGALADPKRVYEALTVSYDDEALGRAVTSKVHEILETCNNPDLVPRFLEHLKRFDLKSGATIRLSQSFLDPAHPHADDPQFNQARTVAYQILRETAKLPQPLPKELEALANADIELSVSLGKAIQSEKWSEAIRLIRLGADVGAHNLRGLADVCAARGNLRDLETLRLAGFDFSKTDQQLLAQGVMSEHLPVVRYLIEHGVPYINRGSEPGVEAVRAGNKAVLDLIISTYQGPPAQWGYIMATAIEEGNRAVFDRLLAMGRVNMASQGWYMVSHAAGNGDLEMVKQLFQEIEKAGGDPKAHIGGAVANAAYGGHVKVLEYLEENGVDLQNHLFLAAQEALFGFQFDTLLFLQQRSRQRSGDIARGCASAIRSTYLRGAEEDAARMADMCRQNLNIAVDRH